VILIQHVETKLPHDDRPENEKKMEQKFMEAEADESFWRGINEKAGPH